MGMRFLSRSACSAVWFNLEGLRTWLFPYFGTALIFQAVSGMSGLLCPSCTSMCSAPVSLVPRFFAQGFMLIVDLWCSTVGPGLPGASCLSCLVSCLFLLVLLAGHFNRTNRTANRTLFRIFFFNWVSNSYMKLTTTNIRNVTKIYIPNFDFKNISSFYFFYLDFVFFSIFT